PSVKDGQCVLLNGHTLSACDLTGLIAAHRAGKAPATLALREDPAAAAWGPVTVDQGSRVLQINGARPLAPDARPLPAPCMFAGIHVLEPEVLEAIPAGHGSIIDVY